MNWAMHPPRRKVRTTGYLLMGFAGLAAILWPAPSVSRAAAGGLAYLWAVLLALGGGTSALGAATDRWLGEYAGLPLLVATFAVYSLSAAASRQVTAVAGACALMSIAALMAARWQDVALIRREAALGAQRERDR